MTRADPFDVPPAGGEQASAAQASGAERPRVLFIGHTTYDLPLAPDLAKKWDAVSEQLDVRVIGERGDARDEDQRFRLIRPPLRTAGGFHLALPGVLASEGRRFRPQVVISQSPFEAFAARPAWRLLPSHPKLIVEVHGDWRTAPRLYGSPLRRALAAASDRAALAGLRRADGTRALSGFTGSLAEKATGRRPLAHFPTYFDLESFTQDPPEPLPDEPTIAWIAMLERYKNIDGFEKAWRLVVERLPQARVVIVGRGSMQHVVDRLVGDLPGNVTAIPHLSPPELRELLDRSVALALPSRLEGMGRVVLEAFARGRPVVGGNTGGIPDLVEPGRNGLLVDPDDTRGIADALVRILSDRELAERLARGAAEDGRRFAEWTPRRYASALRTLVDAVLE